MFYVRIDTEKLHGLVVGPEVLSGLIKRAAEAVAAGHGDGEIKNDRGEIIVRYDFTPDTPLQPFVVTYWFDGDPIKGQLSLYVSAVDAEIARQLADGRIQLYTVGRGAWRYHATLKVLDAEVVHCTSQGGGRTVTTAPGRKPLDTCSMCKAPLYTREEVIGRVAHGDGTCPHWQGGQVETKAKVDPARELLEEFRDRLTDGRGTTADKEGWIAEWVEEINEVLKRR